MSTPYDSDAFAAKIYGAGIKYFGPNEAMARTTSKNKFGTPNSRPSQDLWDNIIPTLIVLDALREHYGQPIKIHSAYRSKAYNQASDDAATGYKGRAKTSQHIAFTAIDFTVTGHPCTQVETQLMKWRDEGKQFYSPVSFQRKAVVVDGLTIPFGELPRTSAVEGGVWFYLRGYIDAYPSDNFTHLDTRGITGKMSD